MSLFPISALRKGLLMRRRLLSGLLVMAALVGRGECAAPEGNTGQVWLLRVMDESGNVPAGAEAIAVAGGESALAASGWKQADGRGHILF